VPDWMFEVSGKDENALMPRSVTRPIDTCFYMDTDIFCRSVALRAVSGTTFCTIGPTSRSKFTGKFLNIGTMVFESWKIPYL